MTYVELRDMIMDESHRLDLVARVPSFVDRAEAMIARDVRAVEMLRQEDLTDADRLVADSPIYILPTDFLEERSITYGDRILRKVGRDALFRMSAGAEPSLFSMRGNAPDAWIEFRGTPGAGTSVGVDYFARLTALVDDADTNTLLERHESLYLHASLFALYMWTQDVELAQGALDTWTNAVERVNELAGRFFGGTGVTPTLNLGHFKTGGSY